MFDAAPAIKPRVQGGRLNVFGVANKSGSQAFSGVKPLAELGVPGFDATAWIALLAPAGTPDDIVRVLNEAMQKILQDPQLKSKLAAIGNEVFIASPQDSQAFIEKEIKFWDEAAEASGVKPSKL
ncbi:tripartite tricarboxylate transporter substrate binding protein [Advenella sp. FME57]|uniref:Bug family tripartite tricarboxylate transporter substrate binding protein n=1 Tax=Advenella sp. FME57 TaxID=2742604 RepID=UPI001868AE91|nr:tripartite tricarboxylate transporter substrate-binding protein [Advenella sp. FME57]